MPCSLQISILCAVPLHHRHSPFAHWAEQYTIVLLFWTMSNAIRAGLQLQLLGGNAITTIIITLSVTISMMLYALFLAHIKLPLYKPVNCWWDIQPVPFPLSSNSTSLQERLEHKWLPNNEITVPSVYIEFIKRLLRTLFCLWEYSKHLNRGRRAGKITFNNIMEW